MYVCLILTMYVCMPLRYHGHSHTVTDNLLKDARMYLFLVQPFIPGTAPFLQCSPLRRQQLGT